ncbi:MAG: protelomerase family protein [Cyanobacteria bacterium P01_F01_bin.150]
MALTREDIIAAYRRRIEQGTWSKLSKSERAALADSFIEMLGYCQSEDDCRVLCEAEIELLEEGYPQNSIANQYLPEWRKAIATAIQDGRLPKQNLPPNDFGKTYDHWALKHLLYSNDVYKSLKQKTTRGNNRKQDDLKPVRLDRFISTARQLLAGDSPQEWAAGLLALTGRRFSEIVAMGQFWPTEHPHAIAFKGQLKKGILDVDQAETFLIATLVDSQEIMVALERFRRHPRIAELQHLQPDDINSRLNSSVRRYIKQAFQDTQLVPILRGEKSVSAHNLRGIYGTIAIRFFCPATQNPHRFIQAHLGHIIGERELANRKNASATEHYFHYVLVGVEGQVLSDRGILLNTVGPLPTAVEDIKEVPAARILRENDFIDASSSALQIELLDVVQDDSGNPQDHQTYPDHQDRQSDSRTIPTTMAKSTPSKKTLSKKTLSKKTPAKKTPSRTTPRTSSKKAASRKAPAKKTAQKSRSQRRSRTSVSAELMDELRAIAAVKFDLAAAATNAEVMAATVRFLKDDTSPKMAASIDSLGSTMSWFTAEIDRLREAIKGLEEDVEVAQSQRDDAVDQLEQYQQKVPNDMHQLAELRTENQALRGELQQFYQLKQLLGGGGAVPPPVSSQAPLSEPSNNLSRSSSRSANRSSSDPSAPPSLGHASATLTEGPTAPVATANPATMPPKRVQHEGTALAAIDRAISLIIQWNDNDDRSFDQKWYISVPILQDLLRGSGYTASQPRLKTAMDNRRQEIDDHHIKHGLGRRHNTRHHQPITTMMTL